MGSFLSENKISTLVCSANEHKLKMRAVALVECVQ